MTIFKMHLERRKRRRIVSFIFILALIAGIVYALFFSNWFVIKDFKVEGVKLASVKEVEDAFSYSYIFWPVRYDNLPLAVRGVAVEKDYFKRAVRVEVTERELFALWCFGERDQESCRWFDEEGIVFLDGPASRGTFIVSVYSPEERHFNKPIFESGQLGHFREILAILDRLDIHPTRLETGALENEELIVYNGTLPIFFNLRIDPGFTEEALKALKSKFSSLVYVDLRSENKAFYKEK